MACARCTTLPRLPETPGTLMLAAPVQELIDKIRDFLSGQTLDYRQEPLGLIVPDVCLTEFLQQVKHTKSFSQHETRDISAILLPPGEQLTLTSVAGANTLERWLGLLGARPLLEILENRRFTTWFQPVICARTGQVIGHESLLRAHHADGTLMFPDEIFSVATSNELLFQVDRQARESALHCAADKGLTGSLFINFVPTAIYDPTHCLQTTFAIAKRFDIAPERMVFEVVETEKVDDVRHLKRILEHYREAGCRIALDDVGSGYASLTLLTELRPDIIKIDMAIIRDVHRDPNRQAVLRAIVGIARDLEIQVLAEGIETEDELEYVLAQGADLLQGYLFARPSPEPSMPAGPPRWLDGHLAR